MIWFLFNLEVKNRNFSILRTLLINKSCLKGKWVKGSIDKRIINGEVMNDMKDEAKIKRRTIIIFSIINIILVAGLIAFIIAIIDGGGGELDSELVFALGIFSLLIMIIAGVADLIYLIFVLVRRSKRKNTSEVTYR